MNARPPFALSVTVPNVVICDIKLTAQTDEVWFLLRSDVHWDNPHCDRKMEKKHLDMAVKRRAGILDFGDLFCAMQGKYDKRSDKSCLRDEHQAGDYLDSLVRTAAAYYEPYAHNFVVIGRGNHESSIRQRHETDLTERLVASLKDRTGAQLRAGGYTGWVVFRFHFHTRIYVVKLWYIHGYAGGGPVTADIIQAQRQVTYIRGADIMCSGHTHDHWSKQYVSIGLNSSHLPEHRKVKYIKCGTYKDEYGTGQGGWHVETGKPPKPIGQHWLRFMPERTGKALKVKFEVTDAE